MRIRILLMGLLACISGEGILPASASADVAVRIHSGRRRPFVDVYRRRRPPRRFYRVEVLPPPPVIIQSRERILYDPVPRYRPRTEQLLDDPVEMDLRLLRSRNEDVREGAARRLGRFGDLRAVPALIEALDRDPEDDVREEAAEALGRLRDPGALPALERAATGKDRSVREAAREAIGEIHESIRLVPTPADAPSTSFELHAPAPDDELRAKPAR